MTNILSFRWNNALKIVIIIVCILLLSLYLFSNQILTGLGSFLIEDETPVQSDAVVVLYTGVDYYPRLMEAADLYVKDL